MVEPIHVAAPPLPKTNGPIIRNIVVQKSPSHVRRWTATTQVCRSVWRRYHAYGRGVRYYRSGTHLRPLLVALMAPFFEVLVDVREQVRVLDEQSSRILARRNAGLLVAMMGPGVPRSCGRRRPYTK